jgi:hypothetical protein
VPEAVRIFSLRGMRAPEVRLSPKFHSCECDFNALSGWVGGRHVRPPRSHLCITQWGGGGVTCVYVRSATLCHITDRPAHPLPLVGVPKPRLRSKIFRGRTWDPKPRFQGAAERGGGQYRRINPNKRVPRHS